VNRSAKSPGSCTDRTRAGPLPGHCLRTPAEGPCECDLLLTCLKFLTPQATKDAPRLRARLAVEQQLIDDATARGWQREIEGHGLTKRRIERLLTDLDRQS